MLIEFISLLLAIAALKRMMGAVTPFSYLVSKKLSIGKSQLGFKSSKCFSQEFVISYDA